MPNNKSNILFKEWFDNIPHKNRASIKKIICDLLEWSNDQFYDSLTRRTINKSEMILINRLAGEQIFDVEPVSEGILCK